MGSRPCGGAGLAGRAGGTDRPGRDAAAAAAAAAAVGGAAVAALRAGGGRCGSVA